MYLLVTPGFGQNEADVACRMLQGVGSNLDKAKILRPGQSEEGEGENYYNELTVCECPIF